jgi:hypothetical protein
MFECHVAKEAARAGFWEGCLLRRKLLLSVLILIVRLGKIPMCAKFVIKRLNAHET